MRILIDGRLYGLENAGLGRYAINLVEHLQKIDTKNEYIILLRKKYFEELKLNPNWTKILADFRHYSFDEQVKLPKIISDVNPDITHFLHFNIPVFYKGKFVVTIHDMLMHQYVGLSATTLIAPIYWVKRLAYKYIFNYAVKKSVKILTPSEAVKNEITNYYHVAPNKISVTYEGVDNEIGMKDCKDILDKAGITSKYIVYSGNAYPHKNLKRLIMSVLQLNNNVEQPIILAIASSRTIFTQRLETLIKNLGAEKYVKLLGFVPDEKLGSLYKNSHAFIAASLSEGFGLPALEAMQSGTLVLASDIPVFKEIYKDVAIYFDPLSVNSIADAIEDSLSMEPKSRQDLIEAGKTLAKKFSWDKMAEETLNIYEEEIKSSSGLRQGQ